MGSIDREQSVRVDENKRGMDDDLLQLTLQIRNRKACDKYANFHGDQLIGYQVPPSVGLSGDLKTILSPKNWPALGRLIDGYIGTGGLDTASASQIAGSLSDYSVLRQKFIDQQVKSKYDRMLHPPLTYLGDAFQYRTADGKFNSVLHPHLGQAGAPYAKTVPSKTAPLGALPDPGDLFDKLMARKEGGRESKSGLSAMLIYHATIIIHDIFRTNDNDKNISDSSSYLDLSPLYGYTMDMQREIRDDRYKLGLLKPDTFAEDRLLRQPPGVCIMLVMYNRYHNYAAKQLYRINENGRFSIPKKYADTKLVSLAKNFHSLSADTSIDVKSFGELCNNYNAAWREYEAVKPANPKVKLQVNFHESEHKLEAYITEWGITKDQRARFEKDYDYHDAARRGVVDGSIPKKYTDTKLVSLAKTFYPPGIGLPIGQKSFDDDFNKICNDYNAAWWQDNFTKHESSLESLLEGWNITQAQREEFERGYDAAWTKLDDDLFNTARLITCGIYVQISVHDYLRALMGFHQFDTNFTLDPRTDFDQRVTTRGLGNQVTVEFNLLYRFHCAISLEDEKYTEDFIKEWLKIENPASTSLQDFLQAMATVRKDNKKPWERTFGIQRGATEPCQRSEHYERNKITNLFNDQQLIEALTSAMDDPISNFGPCNVPKCLKAVEIMGITQARRWEIGTLNDFREFFGLSRHKTFESVSKNVEIQNALRDLYEHPDKIELYPGIFCESDEFMGLDPGPTESSSALWSAIFSDAITLVRSDRFYTTDWNTNSLTSWGMNEVTPNNEICKSSVFHRLIQRAFPGWFEYDSIRFFHPFYTGAANEQFAKAQGYGAVFDSVPPAKPAKPVHLTNFDDILLVLKDTDNVFVHPVSLHMGTLPKHLREVLRPTFRNPACNHVPVDQSAGDEEALQRYLETLMRLIVKRNSVCMTNATFQIDATRDFAIPVVTRYVADFLGFAHLLRTETNPRGSYSENQIYEHITNCQMFLSYSADETKMLKRAKAFRTSMAFMIDLTLHAVVASANQWEITRALFGSKSDNPMSKLGFAIAQKVLTDEPDAGKAAAILVLVCLDFAYDSVISFTAVLDHFMTDLYGVAKNPPSSSRQKPHWLRVQELIFSGEAKDLPEFEKLVQETALQTVRLPIVRIARKDYDGPKKDTNTPALDVRKGQTVILNIQRATVEAKKRNQALEIEFLNSQANLSGKFGAYQPRRFATLALTSMVRFIAQMKNPRRGHDAQGKLKRIFLHWTAEGYSNFMATMRMERISEQVKRLKPDDPDKNILTLDVLKPETDTYLMPSWDEMVPYPMTWKIRFDGYGKSDYSDAKRGPYGKLASAWLRDDLPPWYQPRGPSHNGGTFADSMCVCAASGKRCACPKVEEGKDNVVTPASTGCGLSGSK